MRWTDRMDVAAQQARARTASFDEDWFRRVAAHGAPQVEVAVDGDEDVVEAWVRLMAEGVALGLIQPGEDHLIDRVLRRLVPEQLGAVAPEQRLMVLAEAWNLGEGASEQVWLDRFLARRLHTEVALDGLSDWCVEILESLHSVDEASWAGPYSCRWVDLSAVCEDFLPGDLSVIAPTLVQVRDRRRDRAVVLHLESGADHELLGLGPVTGAMACPGLPRLDVRAHAVGIGSTWVDLPSVPAPRGAVAVPAGVVVVTAEDSQRVWLIAE